MLDFSTDWLGDEPQNAVTEADWERYARLKIAAKKINNEIKDLQEKLLSQGDDWTFKTKYGTVSAYKRVSTTYANSVKEKIKNIQEQAKEEGKYTEKETVVIKYTPPKNL